MVGIRGAENDATYWLVSVHIRSCRQISAHVGMSICADTCQHADKVQMVGSRGAESDATCWHMSTCPNVLTHASMQISEVPGVVSTCWHIPAHVSTCWHMTVCAYVLTHVSMEIRLKWLVSEVLIVMSHVGTCRHVSAHINTCRISTCADTYWNADQVQMIGITGAESDVTCWHVSTHISTFRHISAHVGMYTCADTCQRADKVWMVGIRGAESDATYRHMSAHISTYVLAIYFGMGCEDRGGQNILPYIIDLLGPFRQIWEYARKLSGNSQGKNEPEYGNPLRSLSYRSMVHRRCCPCVAPVNVVNYHKCINFSHWYIYGNLLLLRAPHPCCS